MADADPSRYPSPAGQTGGLAVITGASSGIGLALAQLAQGQGYRPLLVADRFHESADVPGDAQDRVEADLATEAGIDAVMAAIGNRPVAILCANAGEGLGHGFLEQPFDEVRHMVDTNIVGTIDLIQRVGRLMRDEGEGRILVTGSIAGTGPGTYQAVYGATKAFLNQFALALREELRGSGVSVTLLMPGPTDTRFFRRAGLEDTRVAHGSKEEPEKVARTGWQAMMAGDDKVVSGLKNKIESAVATVAPGLAAKRFGQLHEPGGAEEDRARRVKTIVIGGTLAAGAIGLMLAMEAGSSVKPDKRRLSLPPRPRR